MKAQDFDRMNFYLEDNLSTLFLASTVRITKKTTTCQNTSKNFNYISKKAMERCDSAQFIKAKRSN